ncbi:hypothetical protein ASD11_07285 [Aeromicrobium sp. Root495]|uniref:hypothetical protein n=1 Tax=Aeromicrobium sp. Root495 TaxID=1736550 RepID=UPI0006F72B7A|nr:hypothetical protein [Aeromicrobium sp. Root495]KQY59364.1 hypothetical protein ASD11_07285 [Aeromicrobium sp. Root495]
MVDGEPQVVMKLKPFSVVAYGENADLPADATAMGPWPLKVGQPIEHQCRHSAGVWVDEEGIEGMVKFVEMVRNGEKPLGAIMFLELR